MDVDDDMCRCGASSCGSSFMALTTRSPATDEAHRLRDDSELSDMVLGSIDPPGGKLFKLGGVWGGVVCCSILIAPATGADAELALSDDEEPGPRDRPGEL